MNRIQPWVDGSFVLVQPDKQWHSRCLKDEALIHNEMLLEVL